MRRRVLWVLAAVSLMLAVASPASATPLNATLDIQGQGLSVSTGGVGLLGIGSGGSRALRVNIGGPVQAALLYWGGRDRPCPQSGGTCVIPFQPYKDQVLRFDGTLITGTVIGTEAQPVSGQGPIGNIGYLADVTSIVQAAGTGDQVFSVRDGDTASNFWRLDGAGLVVIYTDASDGDTYRVMLYDGLDFAFRGDPTPGATRSTQPVVFSHGSSSQDRRARLWLLVGDAASRAHDKVRVNGAIAAADSLNASRGPAWDSDKSRIRIQAGDAATAVRLNSVGRRADSFLWTAALLRIRVPK
jgi:hypothetical protein